MIDKNFAMVKIRDSNGVAKIVTALRARFDYKKLSDGKYVSSNGLDKTTFSKLMKSRVTGKNVKDENTTTGKIIKQLKADGIWSGELPWELKAKDKEV